MILISKLLINYDAQSKYDHINARLRAQIYPRVKSYSNIAI